MIAKIIAPIMMYPKNLITDPIKPPKIHNARRIRMIDKIIS